jgi:lactate dehydrogenase-like 2-hydroxyacid dehydrogenase
MVGFINDYQLEQNAKALNGESFSNPAYLTVGTVASIAASDTVLTGEIGPRISLTGARTINAVAFSAIRTGASLVNPAMGDTLNASALMTAATGGYVNTAATHAGILQTTNFDVEFVYTLSYIRN